MCRELVPQHVQFFGRRAIRGPGGEAGKNIAKKDRAISLPRISVKPTPKKVVQISIMKHKQTLKVYDPPVRPQHFMRNMKHLGDISFKIIYVIAESRMVTYR
jgi:hypothetical protein